MPLFSKEFHTPEEFFLNQKVAEFEWRSIDPIEVLKKHKANDQPTEYHKKVRHLIGKIKIIVFHLAQNFFL